MYKNNNKKEEEDSLSSFSYEMYKTYVGFS